MENFLYFIGGIIITSIVGVIVAKWQIKKNKIIHFSINSYDVGKGLHNEFPKFQLTYENKELNNEVQVLKGGFINIGRNDITGLKNDSDINIILPKGCSLKDIKIKQLSDDLDVSACRSEKAPNIINFSIDEKFMSGEGFEYTAIIETTEEIKNLHHKIDFKHRIPNTSKIKKEDLRGQQTSREDLRESGVVVLFKNEKVMGLISLIIALFLCVVSINHFYVNKVRYSLVEKRTNKEMSLYMTPQSQFYVSDNSWIPFFDNRKITKEEIDKNFYITFETDYSWGSEDTLVGYILAFMAILYLFSAFMFFYLWNKKKRIYHLLEQYEQE